MAAPLWLRRRRHGSCLYVFVYDGCRSGVGDGYTAFVYNSSYTKGLTLALAAPTRLPTTPLRIRKAPHSRRRRCVGGARALSVYCSLELSVDEKDRKSTRLNSSHANISYAVFCLNKKNLSTKDNTHELQYVQY